MNDHENSHNPRFEWEGEDHFDPDRANMPRQQLFGLINRHQRKIERMLWIYIIASVGIMVYAWIRFDNTEDNKKLIFFAFLFMAAFLNTVLIKLWYWILSNKLGILREIKLLRLETQSATLASPEESPLDIFQMKRGGCLSRTERVWWWAGIITVIILVTLWLGRFPVGFQPDCISKSFTTLSASQATIYGDLTQLHYGPLPLTSLESTSSLATTGPQATWLDPAAPAAAEPPVVNQRILDDRGESLPYIIEGKLREPGGPKYQYFFYVPLTKPIWPGEKWTLHRMLEMKENPLFLFREGNVWNYRIGANYGARLTEFQETVVLPPGAELISVDPKPAKRYTLPQGCDGVNATTTVIEFKERRWHGGQFNGLIKYRFPPKPAP